METTTTDKVIKKLYKDKDKIISYIRNQLKYEKHNYPLEDGFSDFLIWLKEKSNKDGEDYIKTYYNLDKGRLNISFIYKFYIAKAKNIRQDIQIEIKGDDYNYNIVDNYKTDEIDKGNIEKNYLIKLLVKNLNGKDISLLKNLLENKRYYGSKAYDIISYEKIGKKYGISGEMIRQKFNKLINKIDILFKRYGIEK